MEQIIQSIGNYIANLDWSYILTFVLVAYLVNHERVKYSLQKITNIRTKTRYRVAITGVLLGVSLYFIRGYTLSNTESLLNSFVFAMVFHKLIIDAVMQYVAGKPGNPSSNSTRKF